MNRFFLPALSGPQPALLKLTGQEAHHAAAVLRVHPGERVAALDGAGHEFLCTVESADRKELLLRVLEIRTEPPPACRTVLVLAVLKSKAMDMALQKATELGASAIIPFSARRSVAQLDPDDVEARRNKWIATAQEALKQSGRLWMPQITRLCSFTEALERASADLKLVAALHESQPLRLAFDACAARGITPRSAAVWIGPEGDFVPEELAALRNAGALPISLGPHVLRAETAALAAVTLVQHELSSRLGLHTT